MVSICYSTFYKRFGLYALTFRSHYQLGKSLTLCLWLCHSKAAAVNTQAGHVSAIESKIVQMVFLRLKTHHFYISMFFFLFTYVMVHCLKNCLKEMVNSVSGTHSSVRIFWIAICISKINAVIIEIIRYTINILKSLNMSGWVYLLKNLSWRL